MIESPLVQELLAKNTQEALVDCLAARFGAVPQELRQQLRKVMNLKRLKKLTPFAATCPDIAAFQERLLQVIGT